VSSAPLEGLPHAVAEAMAHVPIDDAQLLELAVDPPGLGENELRVAANTRVFIHGWDPLPPEQRDGSYVTVNGDGDDYEVVLYLTRWVLLEAAEAVHAPVASLLGSLTGEVARRGARHEVTLRAGAYPKLVRTGDVASLLPDADGEDDHLDVGDDQVVGGSAEIGVVRGPAAPLPNIRLVSDGWEPIGLAAIQDLVQAALGPVDLDRTPVTLDPATSPFTGCPACEGQRFAYPAELAAAAERMCASHHTAAMEVVADRHRRAERSNPAGWSAIQAAVVRLEEAHLPDHLREPLIAAGIYGTPDDAELTTAAQAALELATRLREEPVEVMAALENDWQADDALVNLPATLADGGLVEDAVAVGDALAAADPGRAALHAAEVTTVLARAGREDEARQRVSALLRAHPGDVQSVLGAGDTMAALGDDEAAESYYLEGLDLADDQDDPEAAADAMERLDELRGVEQVDDLGWEP
jgi:hypothetical protein